MILYITGYGRSGSTITDILLHQHKDTFSVGALNNIYKWLINKEICACGMNIKDCHFWKEVLKRHFSILESKKLHSKDRLQSRVENLFYFPFLLMGWLPVSLIKQYSIEIGSLFKAIFQVSGASVIVDSSKSARDCTGRALALSRYSGINVKVIHLIRDGRAVAWSAMKRSGSNERYRSIEWKPYVFFKTVLSWAITNKMAQITSNNLTPDQYIVVRYEDLTSDPAFQLDRIGKFLKINLSDVIEKVSAGNELMPGHNLGGNRVRFNRSIRFSPDYEWERKLPKNYKTVFWWLAGRMAKKMGYRREGGRCEL